MAGILFRIQTGEDTNDRFKGLKSLLCSFHGLATDELCETSLEIIVIWESPWRSSIGIGADILVVPQFFGKATEDSELVPLDFEKRLEESFRLEIRMFGNYSVRVFPLRS